MSLKSVATSAKRALADSKAKKGDLIAFETFHSSFSLTKGVERYTRVRAGIVRKVTREGVAVSADMILPNGTACEGHFREFKGTRYVSPKARFTATLPEILAKTGDEFDSFESLKSAFIPYVEGAKPAPVTAV